MAEILATVELTEDGRILYLKRYSECRVQMEAGDEAAFKNGKFEVKKSKKMGLHLAIFGKEEVDGKYEWVFQGSTKLDRAGIYHVAVRPDPNRVGYCGQGEFYYGYRVRLPEEESDPIRRQIVADWSSCKRLRVNEVRDWGEVLELKDLYTRDLDRADLPFGSERYLTDGRSEVVQQHKDREHVRIKDATYVIVVLEEANADPYDHNMYRKGVTRVYRKPEADLAEVISAIESVNPRKYRNPNLS